MLYAILNKSWKYHITKQKFYGHLAHISQIIQEMLDTAREVRTN